MKELLKNILQRNRSQFHPIIHFATDDRILPLDLSETNPLLKPEVITDTETFSIFINQTLHDAGCKYGIGGYNELRNLYARSDVFNGDEPRRLHLGVDIWGPAGTPLFAPLPGYVHSFAYNGSFGDYGATIILKHEMEGFVFYTLYGHLSLYSLQGKKHRSTGCRRRRHCQLWPAGRKRQLALTPAFSGDRKYGRHGW